MVKPPLPDHERRDQPVTALLTPREKAAVRRFAQGLGMSQSNAARLLIMRGLTAENERTFTPEGDTDG